MPDKLKSASLETSVSYDQHAVLTHIHKADIHCYILTRICMFSLCKNIPAPSGQMVNRNENLNSNLQHHSEQI